MNKEEALAYFAKCVSVPCPKSTCKKPVGELCDTPAVWVHLERLRESKMVSS